jgi:hypothetical protein
MDGDRYVNDYLTHRTLSRLAVLIPIAVVIAVITGYAFWSGGWKAAYGPCLSPLTSWLPGGGCLPCMGAALRAVMPRPVFVRLVGSPSESGGGYDERGKSAEDSAEAGTGMTRKALRISKEDASGENMRQQRGKTAPYVGAHHSSVLCSSLVLQALGTMSNTLHACTDLGFN